MLQEMFVSVVSASKTKIIFILKAFFHYLVCKLQGWITDIEVGTDLQSVNEVHFCIGDSDWPWKDSHYKSHAFKKTKIVLSQGMRQAANFIQKKNAGFFLPLYDLAAEP